MRAVGGIPSVTGTPKEHMSMRRWFLIRRSCADNVRVQLALCRPAQRLMRASCSAQARDCRHTGR